METIDKVRDAISEVVNKNAITGAVGLTIGVITSNGIANEADKFAVSGLPFGATAGYIGTFTVNGITVADLYPIGGTVNAAAQMKIVDIPADFTETAEGGLVVLTSNAMKYSKFIMTVPEVSGDNGLLEAKKGGRFAWRTVSRVGTAVALSALSKSGVVYDMDLINMEDSLEAAAATSIGLAVVDGIGTFFPSMRVFTSMNKNQVPAAHLATTLPEVSGASVRNSQVGISANPNVPQLVTVPVRAPARGKEVFDIV